MLRPIAIGAALLAAACAARATLSPRPRTAPEARPALRERAATPARQQAAAEPVLALPDGWESCGPLHFERSLERWLPLEPAFRFEESALAVLAAALAGQDERAVRAAVLLARSPDPAVDELLLARLEARAAAPSRERDAAEVVAAAALADRGGARGAAERLVALATGEHAHPDLEVRVECARSALALGRREPLAFLLRVLRAGTPAEGHDPPDWERVPTIAWSKHRAADALARAAGVENAFRPDGSYAHQVEEAQRLERLLAREGGEREER